MSLFAAAPNVEHSGSTGILNNVICGSVGVVENWYLFCLSLLSKSNEMSQYSMGNVVRFTVWGRVGQNS